MIRNVVCAATATLMAVVAIASVPRVALAQAAGGTSSAPSASGPICKDGTTWAKPGRGACRGHGGVDKARTHAATGAASGAATEHGSAEAAAGGTSAPLATSAAGAGASERTEGSRAAGGGAGQVWVNTSSKVYHCPGTHWYGKTKQGKYVSESEARAEGDRPDHGKGCS